MTESTIIGDEPCPKCRERGGDSTGNHLILFSNGNKFCNRCDYKVIAGREEVAEELTIADILKKPIADIPDRGISRSVAELYGYRVDFDETTGEISRHYAPFFKNGELSGFKVRNVADKTFYGVGDLKGVDLFGSPLIGSGGQLIIITEGELDALAASEMFRMHGKKYRVVSLQHGANVAGVQRAFAKLNQFTNVVLCLDQDKKGKEAADNIIPLFDAGKVKVMTFSEKDANDMLLAGKVDEFFNSLRNASAKRPDGIVSGADTWEKIKDRPKVESIPYPEEWELLNQKAYGVRRGEVDTWTSGCVDSNTEFLSPSGWKKISEYNGGLVAQYSASGLLEFVKPNAYIKQPASQLYHIKTKYGVDQVLSDNHNVVWFERRSGMMHRMRFSELRETHNRNSYGFTGKFKATYDLEDTGFKIDGKSDAYLRLSVALAADGYLKNNDPFCIYFNLSKQRKINRLKELLSTLEWEWNEYSHSENSVTIRIEHSMEKGLSHYFGFADPYHKLELLADEVKYWDSDGSSFFTTQKDEADLVQHAFTAIHGRSSIYIDNREDRPSTYSVYLCGNDYVGISGANKPTIETIETEDGYQYCFNVPSNTLILRRNGCIFITGNSGMGKTAVLRELQYHLLNTVKDSIGVIALEEPLVDSVEALMALNLNKRIQLPDVRETVSDDELYKAWLATSGTNRLHYYDHFGSVDDDSLISKIRWLAGPLGCKYIFLDHLSIVISEFADQGGERERIDTIMTRLKRLTQELNIWLGLVVHLRKVGGGSSFEEGAVPSLDDLRGSGSIKQLSNNVYALSRNQQHGDERIRNTSTLHVLKCRFTGRTGVADQLYFEDTTGRMVPADYDVNDEEF
ncbi:MAG: toprim domain-containing protein [candidate division Zixibacteria bacterium]|nr:toprim domain-containing protein [candidate division Zixibacteria bacterium]